MNKFKIFLNNLSNNNNKEIIKLIESAYTIIYEAPHLVTIDDEPIDLFVEKMAEHGNEATYIYVCELLQSIINNDVLIVPKSIIPPEYNNMLNVLENPHSQLANHNIHYLKNILTNMKNNLKNKI